MYGMNPYTFQFNQPQQFGQQPGFPGQQSPFQPMGMNLPQPQQQAVSAAPVVLYVPNVSDVKEVDLHGAANALIIVQNEPVIAMKTAANSMGLTATDYYHLDKFDPASMSAPASSQDFVTRAEFQQFVNSLRAPVADPQAAPVKKEAVKK